MRSVDVQFKKIQGELFKEDLFSQLRDDHPLLVIGKKIKWVVFDERFGVHYARLGRAGIPTRIMVGLHYLKHAKNLSDDEVLAQFSENPYWQAFCGYLYFELQAPCDTTTMVKWRQRVGEEGMELLLQETCAVALDMKLLKPSDAKEVIVDTTVQEKNVMYPTDAKLLNRARQRLVKEAKRQGIKLRQSYTRNGKLHVAKYQRYCHAKQFKRAKKPLRRLKTFLGRIIRDIERKAKDPSPKLEALLAIARKVYSQERHSANKIYSIHEPEVECISKGKSHKRYEFGCKASLMTTNRSNWIVGAMAHHDRPYDGHTLESVLTQAKRIIGCLPQEVFADKGYRGARLGEHKVRVHISGTQRGKTKRQRRLLRRRSAIEPIIGHTKTDNRLGRNFLKGILGDKNNIILAASGRNFCKLLAACIFFDAFFQNYLRLYS
jgi:transposase, IS5 family